MGRLRGCDRRGAEGRMNGAPHPASHRAPKVVPPIPKPRSFVDWATKLSTVGPMKRIETGIPALDEACRGGLPMRRLVVVGGAPGAGKTTLVNDVAYRAALLGIFVLIHAVDEGPEGVVYRIAQNAGFDAAKLEEGDVEEWKAAIAKLQELRISIEDDSKTIEEVADMLAGIAKGAPAILVEDSIQKVRSAGSIIAVTMRDRVNANVAAAKAKTEQHGFLTLATCELTRGAYRSRQASENISDLAAFKESGDIEYAAQTALVIRTVPDTEGIVEVTVPKNRGPRFTKPTFRLRLDHGRARFEQIAFDPADATDDTSTRRFGRARSSIVNACRKDNTLNTPTKIALAAGGQKAFVLKVVKELVECGDLVLLNGGYRPKVAS